MPSATSEFIHVKGCRITDRPYVDILNESCEVIHVELIVSRRFKHFSDIFKQSNRILAPRDKYHVVLPCDCIVEDLRKITRGTNGCGSNSTGTIREVIESSTICITYIRGLDTVPIGRFCIHRGRSLIVIKKENGRVTGEENDEQLDN